VPACIDPTAAAGNLPSDDTYLDATKPDNIFGATNRLYVRANNSADYRALLRYDLSAIPANADITGAKLYLTGNNTASDQVIYVYRVTAPWSEGTTTWQSWTNPGGDFDSSLAYALFVPTQANCALEIDLTDLVQQWVDGSLPNYGVLLYATGSDRSFSFYSKDDPANIERAPKLNVTYTVMQTHASEKNFFTILLDWLQSF
jgi:hypothetical protein